MTDKIDNARIKDLEERVKDKFDAFSERLYASLKNAHWGQSQPTDDEVLAMFELRTNGNVALGVGPDPDFVGACELTEDGTKLLKQVARIQAKQAQEMGEVQ